MHRIVVTNVLAFAVLAAPASAALRFSPCADAAGFQCATQTVPLDYDKPHGKTISIAVTRLPATDQADKIGTLVVNYGGPGAAPVAQTQAQGESRFARLRSQFDIVAFDPRGVGESTPSLSCDVDQPTAGLYRQPLPTPATLDKAAELAKARAFAQRCASRNAGLASHVSTANVARDMDRVRRGLRARRLNYLGYSYGTLLGATYARLFPKRYRAMALDGPVDPRGYLRRPLRSLAAQTAGFEGALQRYFAACEPVPAYCRWMAGKAPEQAYDDLVAAVGGTLNLAVQSELYAKFLWPELTDALNGAATGDTSLVRTLVDRFYGRRPDGSFDPSTDRYFMIGAGEQRYPSTPETYFAAGAKALVASPHFFFNNGYVELNYGVYKPQDADAYAGSFKLRKRAGTPLVVATTNDPATPYAGAGRLVKQLGRARLLTMDGDGHTAFPGNSACVDEAVIAYLQFTRQPAKGTRCQQTVAFPPPPYNVPAARFYRSPLR